MSQKSRCTLYVLKHLNLDSLKHILVSKGWGPLCTLTFFVGEDRLERAYEHHDHHHDGEEGDGVAGHPHDKGVERQLLPRTQS